MARPSPHRHSADDSDAELGIDNDDPVADDDAAERDPQTEALWAEVRLDPIEVSLPTGTGYTLRAYRPSTEVTAPDLDRTDEEEDLFAGHRRRRTDIDDTAEFDELAPDDADDEEIVARAERVSRRRSAVSGRVADRGTDDADDADETDGAEEPTDAELDDALDADETDTDDEEIDAEEDVPVFLGHGGKLFLFRTPESLVEFVRSGAANDMAQLDSWAEVVERIRPEDVTPRGEDTYELDLVVENLRGGHDTWDAELLIGAGEIARDLGYALRFEPILTALAPGSPLDDLDEALRSSVSGGLGAFFARRKLRKIGAQQATLGWRTIIGKISGVVDWRD